MAISISLDRPAAALTNNVIESIEVGTATASGTDVDLRVFLDNLTIDTESIADLSLATGADITYASTGNTITTGVAGTFDNVRVGDVVSATVNTGDFSGQTVELISVDGLTLTLSANPDAQVGSQSAGETLVFTPGDIDSTLYFIKFTHTISGNNLVITPKVSCFDGSLVAEGVAGGTADSDEVVFADGSVKTLPVITINLDAYLTGARVARV